MTELSNPDGFKRTTTNTAYSIYHALRKNIYQVPGQDATQDHNQRFAYSFLTVWTGSIILPGAGGRRASERELRTDRSKASDVFDASDNANDDEEADDAQDE